MKQGVIVTLHKGHGKRKDNPDNYRAITLLPTIIKLYEHILLGKTENRIESKLATQQGGFQRNLGCIMTSFILKESITYNREYNSKVHVCFLDARQAFDRVWHTGLFVKLNDCSLPDNVYLSLYDLYRNRKSCVRLSGQNSDWLNIDQGTPQGSRSSPTLYLLYINELIEAIEASGHGLCVYGHTISSLTVADDMLLISLTSNGLQQMIDICYAYSLKWRYEYNVSKCSVLVFNERNPQNSRIRSEMSLGNDTIPYADSYRHLGILLDVRCRMTYAIDDANVKLRKSFYGLVARGISPSGFSPLTLLTIYKSIGLPKALYGCELWNSAPPSHLDKLERSHRLCAKAIQGLLLSTSTDVALGALGLLPI